MQVRSDAAEDAEGGFFTPPRRGAGTNKDAQEKNNGNARFSDTDSDDLSIDTGKARPSRAGRADWNLLGFWDRAQVLESEIQSELLQLATDLMEQSGLIEWPSANHDDAIERLGLWQLLRGSSDRGRYNTKDFSVPSAPAMWMPVKAPHHSFSILHLTGMRRRRALPGALPPDQQSTWKGGDGEMDLGRRVPNRQRHGDGCARHCGCCVPPCRRVHARRLPSHG